MCSAWKNDDFGNKCGGGGGNEQKNNNLSYIVTDFRSVINLTHIGSFDVKKVGFDTQEYFHECKNEVKLDHTITGDKGHQIHSQRVQVHLPQFIPHP